MKSVISQVSLPELRTSSFNQTLESIVPAMKLKEYFFTPACGRISFPGYVIQSALGGGGEKTLLTQLIVPSEISTTLLSDQNNILYHAPFASNQTIQGAVPLEALAGLGIMAGWRWLSNWSLERFERDHLEIFLLEYELILIKPVNTDFSALSQNPSEDMIGKVMRYIKNHNRSAFTLRIEILDTRGQVMAVVNSRYGIFLSPPTHTQRQLGQPSPTTSA